MSKAKIRRKSKIFSERLENRCWYLNFWYKKPIQVITNFNCDDNFNYLNAISNYELIKAFKIHNLWIRYLDANKSCLVCEWNRDARVIHDLAPFWDIYDLINEGKDTNTTLINLINKYESEYKYSVPMSPKDKYKEYLKLNKRKRFEKV